MGNRVSPGMWHGGNGWAWPVVWEGSGTQLELHNAPGRGNVLVQGHGILRTGFTGAASTLHGRSGEGVTAVAWHCVRLCAS